MKAANNHIGQTPTMSFTNNSQVVFHYMNVTKLVIKLVIEFDSNIALARKQPGGGSRDGCSS